MQTPTVAATSTNTATAANQTPAPLVPTKLFVANSRVDGLLPRMGASCRYRHAASSAMFLPEDTQGYEAYAFNYKTGLRKQMNLLAAPKDGMVRGTIVINVSGHAGDSSLEQFAKTNTYNVRVQLPDGRVLQRNNIPRNDPSQAEYVTTIPVEFPYQPGMTRLEAWPTGSAGPSGYVEGRVYEIHSPDQRYDAGAARRAALDSTDYPPRTPYSDI